ncbi:Ldh family oxidoreductase [Puniceibacterium confluentis]|uniref:Ldh family oxidoreductase n=1 Tax=Puniceibacterium confluentis TaxID=1958944 RepID=UPI0011B59A71|nr:Ldh family oxidoreductase [Puniceibacterium confluentis]
MTLTEQQTRDLVRRAFVGVGVPDTAADDAAEVLTLAEMMGIRTHGLNRVLVYADRIAGGGIDPRAEAVISAPAPALRQVQGNNGLGPAIAHRALIAAMGAARDLGLGAAFVRGGTHVGALAPYLWIAAEAGFACVMTSTTAAMIAPAGGRGAMIGNNPLGIAVPDPGGAHVILDMALSVAARSRVRAAAETGREIPESWATDAEGRPTTDPAAAMQGLMRAIGGDKGANLALCLDLMAAGLSGAAMLSDIGTAAAARDTPQNLGQMILLVDTRRLLPEETLSERMQQARDSVTQSVAIDPSQPVRMPGDRALRALCDARANGLSLPDDLLDRLGQLAG